MYDPTFGPESLKREFQDQDFKNFPNLTNPAQRQEAVQRAVEISKQGFGSLVLKEGNVSGRKIYSVPDIGSKLVLRKAVRNLRVISQPKQSNRIDVVQKLMILCRDATAYTIIKTDIRKFYQSIDIQHLNEIIGQRLITAPGTRNVLENFLIFCLQQDIQGLPPGLAISALLSEFYMQDFDRKFDDEFDPYMYVRYVDDICAILPIRNDKKEIICNINRILPGNLNINYGKTRIFPCDDEISSNISPQADFDYLGFRFQVFETKRKNSKYVRNVVIDISKKKIKKVKTKLYIAFRQFQKDGSFIDLNDRVKLIIYNYRFKHHRKKKEIYSGIRNTYPFINSESEGLNELDKFLKGFVHYKAKIIDRQLVFELTKKQKSTLLKLSFKRAFGSNTYFYYNSDRLANLVRCWRNV